MECLQEDIEGGIASKIQAYCLLDNDDGVPRDKESFFSYPERCGYVIRKDYSLELQHTPSNAPDLGRLLQRWLYFGLLYTVVQDSGEPLLSFEGLVKGRFLHTASLRPALERWFRYETQFPDQLRFRMIQVERVLDFARNVVNRNCGYDSRYDLVPYSWKDIRGPRYLQDECALVLMIVGEALSAVQRRILEEPGRPVFTSGWNNDENPGWGPPRWVFAAMKKQGWCPRAIQLLQGQLRSCATLLVAAFSAYDGAPRMIEDHQKAGCTAEHCHVRASDRGMWYHETKCDRDPGTCTSVGADMDKVVEIIMSRDCIPLLEFHDKSLKPRVIAFNPLQDKTQYFVISHVWSDGWGNELKNELRECQLDFLRRQISRAAGGKNVPFWMDTLLVPISPNHDHGRIAKAKAINQIYEVFAHATGTVMLDNGLLDMPYGSPIQAAMRFLASSWMRRLWTLQEAWLSRRLFIPFKEAGRLAQHMTDLKAMRDELEQQDRATTAIYRMVLDQFREHFGGQERVQRLLHERSRRYLPVESQRGAAEAVAAVWRAARWRNTVHPAHEVYALATLLDLNFAQVEASAYIVGEDAVNQMSGYWRGFWMSFQEQYPGGIPAGLIFLPGPKIDKLRGFGWSPLTWMSATQVDYPGPLTIWNGHTTLYAGEYQTWSGLGVTYPGFLLHVHDLDARLRLVSVVTAATGKVQFAVDADLTEWYSFEPADDSWSVAQAGRYILKSDSQLAIIMSRPRPRFAPEIALFVEVCQTTRRRTASDALVYCCRIIRRVWIQRASLEKDHSDRLTYTQFLTAGSNNDSVTIGEELSSDQAWIVDEFHSKYPADEIESVHAPPPPIPSAATGQTVPAVPSKWLSTVKRTIWWPTESTESVAS